MLPRFGELVNEGLPRVLAAFSVKNQAQLAYINSAADYIQTVNNNGATLGSGPGGRFYG